MIQIFVSGITALTIMNPDGVNECGRLSGAIRHRDINGLRVVPDTEANFYWLTRFKPVHSDIINVFEGSHANMIELWLALSNLR